MKDINILLNNGVNLKKSMDLFGDMATYDEMLNDFLAEVDGKIAKLTNFKGMGDIDNYAILAHSLKSDARYFGFEKLAELAYAHELEGKAKNIGFVNNNFDELMTETNRIVELVKKYVNGVNDSVVAPTINDAIAVTEKSILIVDDSDLIIKIASNILKNDYNIITAMDGQEAIKLIEANRMNLLAVLLDLNMPGINGFQVLEHLRTNNIFNDVPVSIITGADDKESIDKAFTYPIVDMLIKPFNEQMVKDVVTKTINAKHW